MTQTHSFSKRSGPLIIAILVLLLLVLRQDNWFWTDGRLVFGFLPIGLFWHACISLAAAGTWWLATKIAFPFDDGEGPGPEHGSADTAAGDAGPSDVPALEGQPE